MSHTIELKNIKPAPQLSEETNAFAADIYMQGKKVGYAKNDGHGGATFYAGFDAEGRKAIALAEAYYKSLPPVPFNGIELPMSLEMEIDELVADFIFQKQIAKDSKKGICYGTKFAYQIVGWQGFTIEKLKQHPQGDSIIKAAIAELKAAGHTILNTNLAL